MPTVLETFEFPHGGRKGLEYDFNSLMDGKIYQLVQGDDFDVSADTFLGALSRAANAQNKRVNKHVSDDKKTVTVRVRPKLEKPEKADGKSDEKPTPKVPATAKA